MVLDLNVAEVFARDTVECGNSAIIEEAGRDSARRFVLLMLLVIGFVKLSRDATGVAYNNLEQNV